MFEKPYSDYLLSSAPFFQYIVLIIQDILISAGAVVPGELRNVNIVLASFPMILALIVIIRTKPKTFTITYAVVFYLVLCTFIFSPQNEQFLLKEIFYLLCINVPCFLCIVTIDNMLILKKTMLYISYPILLLGVLYFIFLINGVISLNQYDMAFGYYLLIPAVVFLNQNRMVYTFMFILTCILILLVGSRGALLAALLYSLFLLLIDRKSRTLIVVISVAVIICGVITLMIIPDFINISDMSYRTLNMIREGGIVEDSNRFSIYSAVWENILESPVRGHGIYGDRVILDGAYSHNFFLEFFYDFGLYAGSFLFLIISYIFFRSYLSLNTDGRKLLIMFFCYCFVPLMYSKSYLNDPGFGILLGSVIALPKSSFSTKLIHAYGK